MCVCVCVWCVCVCVVCVCVCVCVWCVCGVCVCVCVWCVCVCVVCVCVCVCGVKLRAHALVSPAVYILCSGELPADHAGQAHHAALAEVSGRALHDKVDRLSLTV